MENEKRYQIGEKKETNSHRLPLPPSPSAHQRGAARQDQLDRSSKAARKFLPAAAQAADLAAVSASNPTTFVLPVSTILTRWEGSRAAARRRRALMRDVWTRRPSPSPRPRPLLQRELLFLRPPSPAPSRRHVESKGPRLDGSALRAPVKNNH